MPARCRSAGLAVAGVVGAQDGALHASAAHQQFLSRAQYEVRLLLFAFSFMLRCLRCVLVLRVVLSWCLRQAALAGSVDRDNDEKMDQQATLHDRWFRRCYTTSRWMGQEALQKRHWLWMRVPW